MFAYSTSGITPNNTDFAELDITARASHTHLFDGLSKADNGEVIKKIGNARVWIGESHDGKSVEIATERKAFAPPAV
ncbi:hypothetical protein CALCODRAFT_494713 [Calocera cornea HHB12733]|uniref:Uncharacterized protein n=1 Tax=Calocera cornea HHB12733 TaxID=1353952 RepID=A0A165GXG6_9BASI|nr:hypothetical protein CALCODRAFT_494713 [Calocera cornea HHB12733]